MKESGREQERVPGGGSLGSEVKVRQDLFSLVGEEVAQPHTEDAVALGGNFTLTPFALLSLGLSAFDAGM